MFSRLFSTIFNLTSKQFATSAQVNSKVAVLGASGGIGQPLSLLLKDCYDITHLSLYDIAPVTKGVAVDLSHMNTRSKVTGHIGPEQLSEAVQGADVIVIPAGIPRKPGMSRDDLFSANASIVRDLVETIACCSPKALIAIITNPVNSTVPIAAEVLCKAGVFEPSRVFGVTTLDVVRAAAFIGEINCVDPSTVCIPVIGGHSGVTILPVLSRSQPPVQLCDQEQIKALTKRIQEAGTEVVNAKAGGGSATLSMAYAGARFTFALLKGLQGVPNVVECAYVQSDVTEAKYFASPLLLGRNGVEQNLGVGQLNDFEQELLSLTIQELLKNIKTGENFMCKK